MEVDEEHDQPMEVDEEPKSSKAKKAKKLKKQNRPTPPRKVKSAPTTRPLTK